jgi:hypothetical protein
MRFPSSILCLLLLAGVASADLQAVPDLGQSGYFADSVWLVKDGKVTNKIGTNFSRTVSAYVDIAADSDEIWLVKDGQITRRFSSSVSPQIRIYGPRGGSIVFRGCPPQPPSPPAEPPKFDFPDDPVPESPVAPRSSPPLGAVLMGVAAAAGLASGYIVTRPAKIVPLDDDDEPEAGK